MAAPSPQTAPPRAPLVLDELFAELTWPILWKAGKLALRPARIGIAVLFLLASLALLSLGQYWINRNAETNLLADRGAQAWGGVQSLIDALWGLNLSAAGNALTIIFITAPSAALHAAPATTIIILPLLLVLTALAGGAICRSAATELAWSRPIPWPTAIAMAVSRWRSLIGALVLPLGVVWVAALGLAAIGWALFNVGALSILGGLLWLLFLAVSLFVSVIMLGLVLGHWMLIPAVVCEGADAIDATQHTLSMVFGKPLRLLMYLLMLLAQGLLLLLLIGILGAAALAFARLTAGAWLDADHRVILDNAVLQPPESAAKGLTGAARAGSRLVHVSTVVFFLIGLGVMVSYAWCAATALFLAMRRTCDGQDVTELWSPGMIEGTTSANLRADAAAVISTPHPPAESITDNGPADEG